MMHIAVTLAQGGEYVIQTGSGAAVRLPAAWGGQYRLTDRATGLGPAEMVTGRVGNDLHIAFAGESILYPSLVLEDYFPGAESKALVGLQGNGALVAYLPESAAAADSVHLLAEQMAAAQVLPGAATAATDAVSPFAILGGMAGAGLAVAALAGSSNRHTGKTDDAQPQTPFVPDAVQPETPQPPVNPPPVNPPPVNPPPVNPPPVNPPPVNPPPVNPPPVNPPPVNPPPVNPPPLTPANHAPHDLDVSPLQVAENVAGAVVGKIVVSDRDAGDSHTFRISDPRFEIAGDVLKLKPGISLEYDNEKTVALTITVTDRAGDHYTESFTLAVEDDPTYPAPPPTPNTPATLAISGVAQSGKALTAVLDDADGVPNNVQFQWFADGEPIANASGNTFTPTYAEVGKAIHVEARYTDNARHPEQPRSAATGAVRYGIHHHDKYGDYLDVREFGADLSGQTDSSAAISKALATAHAQGVALYLGAGDLKISQQIKLDAQNTGVKALFGDGMGKTTIHFDWQQQGVHNPDTNLTDSRAFAGILIDGVNGKTLGDFSLQYHHQDKTDFYRPGESYFGRVNGIVVNDASHTRVEHVEVSGANRAGIYFGSQHTVDSGLRDRLIRGEIGENDVPAGVGNRVIGGHFHGNRVAGILFAYQKDFLAEGNHLARNGHENDGGTGYGIASLAGSYNFGVTYRGNHSDHNYRKGLDIHDGNRILIENNTAIGDRLHGIAVYNRQFAMNDVIIRNNTIEADPAFRLPVDDGDKGTTRVVEYHGYAAIQIQTNEKFRDLGTAGPGKFTIENNTIKNLAIYRNEQQTYGIEFRNHETTIDYRLDIHGNHIEGESSKYLIAILNNTKNPQSGDPGPGSGSIHITANTASIGHAASGGVPLYIEEKSHNGQLRGEVEVRSNHITIRGQSHGSAEFLQFIGNAARYHVSDNTFATADRADKPLISLHGHGGADKPVLDVHGNTFATGLDTLHANWLERGQKNGADASIHARDNTHNGQPLNHILIADGDNGKTLIISPSLTLETFAKLIELDSSDAALEHLGHAGKNAFAAPLAHDTGHFHGSTGDDILVIAGKAQHIIAREGNDTIAIITGMQAPDAPAIHNILDYGNGHDSIRLIAGDGERIDNLRFDSASGILSYDYHSASGGGHRESIHIRAHNGLALHEEDILKNVQIL